MEHTMHMLKNENESDDEPESEVIDESLVNHQHCQNLVTEQDSANLPATEATANKMKTKINHDVESMYVKEETSLDCVVDSSEPEMTSSQGEDLLTEYNTIQSACYKEGDADIDRKEELTFKEQVFDDEDNEVLAVRIKQRWQHCQNIWKQSSSETEMTSGQDEEDPMSEHDAVESVTQKGPMDNSRKKRRTKIKEEPVSDDEANTNGSQTVVEPVLILKIKERWQHCQSAWKQQPSQTEITSGPEEDPLSEQSSMQSINLKEEVPRNTSEQIPEIIHPPTAVFIKQESNKMPKSVSPKGRKNWNEDDLKRAVEECRKGSSIRSAAEKYGVSKSTLHGHVSGSAKSCKLGPKTMFSEYEEKELASLLLNASRKGFPLAPTDVRKAAFEYAEMCQYDHKFNNKTKCAGRKWLSGFLKRNTNLSIKTPEAHSQHRGKGLNRETISEFYTLLHKVLEENNLFDKPEYIYIVDESGLSLQTRPSKIISECDNRDSVANTNKERGENVTVVACCSASGAYIPPFIIYKGIRRKQEFGEKLPPRSTFTMTETGYINEEVFLLWLKHFDKNRSSGICLLILDGHASHCKSIHILDFCEKNDIIPLCLPGHCTHRLQPLNRSFFKPLEVNYFAEGNTWLKNNVGRNFTKFHFPEVFSAAWSKTASIHTAVNGFRACGISPWNPDAISDHVFVPSEVLAGERKSPFKESAPSTSKETSCSREAAESLRLDQGMTSPSKHKQTGSGLQKKCVAPRKRTFTTLIPVLELRTPPKKQKTVVLTTPQYKKDLKLKRIDVGEVTAVTEPKTSVSGVQNAQGCIQKKCPEPKETGEREKLVCGFCGVSYYSEGSGQMGSWIKCEQCQNWYHEVCVGSMEKKQFSCGKCIAKSYGIK